MAEVPQEVRDDIHEIKNVLTALTRELIQIKDDNKTLLKLVRDGGSEPSLIRRVDALEVSERMRAARAKGTYLVWGAALSSVAAIIVAVISLVN